MLGADGGKLVFPMLRQQTAAAGEEKRFASLADFVSKDGPDYLGAFAVTAGIGADDLAKKFEAELDDYSAILVKALADRLAEALAEMLHQRVRREWGYGKDERFSNEDLIAEKYRGIRPAFGYPACPDHTEKGKLFALLGAERIGVALTEHCAMTPGSERERPLPRPPRRALFHGRQNRQRPGHRLRAPEGYADRGGGTMARAEPRLRPAGARGRGRGVRGARVLAVLVPLLAACKTSSDAAPPPNPCGILFGNPNDASGLDSNQCRPACSCGDATFTPPTYGPTFVQAMLANWQLAVPYPEITSNPYAMPAPPDNPPGTVCAVLPQGDAGVTPRPYTLVTYASADLAQAAGAMVTHFGHCGVCSPLVNLAVYMQQNDLTAPVRACGLLPENDAGDADVQCLQGLGFDLPVRGGLGLRHGEHAERVPRRRVFRASSCPTTCPTARSTRALQCDEDQSGPVFKAVAGRTRRNTGLPNAICRPCSEVQPLVHAY